jgi:hypothetical protein
MDDISDSVSMMSNRNIYETYRKPIKKKIIMSADASDRPLNPANSRIYMRANWLLFPKSVVCKSKLRSKHTPNRPKNSKSSIGSRTEITKSKRSIRKGRATLRLWLCLKLSMENWTIIRRPVLSKAACRGLVSIQMEALFL